MGRGGAIAILLVVFMAVTSAVSAELIAVSSLFTYDLYRTYHRPQATNDEIVRVSHYFICFWAVWAGCWSTILHKASIDLGWLFYVQGVVLSPAVIPIALTVSWSKLTRAGVFAGSLAGAVLGMLAWMVGCWKIYGEINVPNLAEPYSAVCSGLTGLLFSGLVTVLVSLTSDLRGMTLRGRGRSRRTPIRARPQTPPPPPPRDSEAPKTSQRTSSTARPPTTSRSPKAPSSRRTPCP
ncbi:hypothetical protein C8Q73DRAFT_264291 [Cubamyces lactineus]|nr:hypothetical protein C8Q73DRAFT_264291 [Cubamyces lactineus]